MATTSQPTSVPTSIEPHLSNYTTPPNSQGHPQAQQFARQQQQQQHISPNASTTNTPSAQSPVSLHKNAPTVPQHQLPLAQRQIRPPKSPMYIPAALRPTDRPPRASPLTPPRSVHGSTDSLDDHASALRPPSRRSTGPKRNPANPLTKVPESSTPASHPTAERPRRQQQPPPRDQQAEEGQEEGDTSSETDSLSSLPPLHPTSTPTSPSTTTTSRIAPPPPPPPPTRHHWKPDRAAPICDGPTCQKTFGRLFERRHHCRHCGNVFCGEHSRYRVPLDKNAEFHPLGGEVRACEHCWGRWIDWKTERKARKKKGRRREEAEEEEGGGALASPVRFVGGKAAAEGERGNGAGRGGAVGSVAKSYDWSTF